MHLCVAAGRGVKYCDMPSSQAVTVHEKQKSCTRWGQDVIQEDQTAKR